jgi:uncharacterized protein (UPF0332 family)
MNIDECFDKRILRKISPDIMKSGNSLKMAENKLKVSRELADEEFFDQALITAYTAMFHASRAILYRDGIQEKSHFAVYIYLNEKYSREIPKKLIESFRILQMERHEALYGFDSEITEGKARLAIEDAEIFIVKIRGMLK